MREKIAVDNCVAEHLPVKIFGADVNDVITLQRDNSMLGNELFTDEGKFYRIF